MPLGEPMPGVAFPGQPEGGDSADETEPMTEQHMAFLQQVSVEYIRKNIRLQ